MKNLTAILDRVANELETRGLKKLAFEVDVVANTLEDTWTPRENPGVPAGLPHVFGEGYDGPRTTEDRDYLERGRVQDYDQKHQRNEVSRAVAHLLSKMKSHSNVGGLQLAFEEHGDRASYFSVNLKNLSEAMRTYTDRQGQKYILPDPIRVAHISIVVPKAGDPAIKEATVSIYPFDFFKGDKNSRVEKTMPIDSVPSYVTEEIKRVWKLS